jgi:hypothetical protein
MGGGASKTVPREDSRVSASGNYNDPQLADLIKNASKTPSSKGPAEGAGHAISVQEGASAVDAILAEQRLQKLAFQGDKPGWKEVQRDYNLQSDHGVNRSPKVEWSDKMKSEAGPIAPPKDRAPPKISSSQMAAKPRPPSNSSIKPSASPMARPQMSPAPSQTLNKTDSGLIVAPSALAAPSAPIDFAPAGYSSASTIDLGATQRKSVVSSGGARADAGADGATLVPAVSIKPNQGSPTRPPNKQLHSSQIFATPNSAAGPLKPHPPSGGPPPQQQQVRRDSDGDVDDDKIAEFTDEEIISLNRGLRLHYWSVCVCVCADHYYLLPADISTTKPRNLPKLIIPRNISSGSQNQTQIRSVSGMSKIYSDNKRVSGGQNNAMKTLPNNAPPPSGPAPPVGGHSVRQNVPVNMTSGAAANADLIAKKFPHAVKETSDVKRNRAQLPSTLTHAVPTTGDWLKKRYIVNNYILLDTLGTGSYGEVSRAPCCALNRRF